MELSSLRSSIDGTLMGKEREESHFTNSHEKQNFEFQTGRRRRIGVWLALLLFFVALSIVAGGLSRQSIQWSYEKGFETDYETVRSSISLVQHSFTGAIKLESDNKTFYREKSPGPQYVGKPSAEIDANWNNLLRGLNFDALPGQVNHLQEETFRWPSDGMFFLGLDVFHSLHCLNRLRQALDLDYYRHELEMTGHPSRQDHIDHCIDQLRQVLMCHADLTPMTWEERGNKLLLKTSTVHTCRDFQKIWDFTADARDEVDYRKKEELVTGKLFIVD